MTKSRRLSPEQRELDAKKVELATLEVKLVQQELDLTTLRAELRTFEAQYVRIVGAKFAARDELEAQVAEVIARQRPQDFTAGRTAADARARARESAEAAVLPDHLPAISQPFSPTDDLKRLYREIAKLVHPDLTTDDRERERRTRMMAAANQAFANGDKRELERILEEWETSPEFVPGEGIGPELVRTIRKLHQANQRLGQIDEELSALRHTDLYQLKERCDVAQSAGRDLLADMAEHLDAEIAELTARLAFVEKEAMI